MNFGRLKKGLWLVAFLLRKLFVKEFLLTGMGRDGAQGIAELSQKRGNTNIIQDRESCVVFGQNSTYLSLSTEACVKHLFFRETDHFIDQSGLKVCL